MTSRFPRPWLLPCLLGAASVLAVTAAASAQDYKIKFHRTEKVGDTYTLSAKGSSNSQTNVTVPGAPPQKQDQKDEIELEGTIKVLEVDSLGQATEVSITVGKCLLNDKPLCDAGEVITAQNDGTQTQFTLKGQKVDAPTAKALAIVIDTTDPQIKADDDMAFGTDRPQKVGGTWPVHSETIARQAARHGMAVKSQNVKGTGKLEGVKQEGGKDVLTVVVDLTVDELKPPLPANFTVEGGSMTMRMSGRLPADEKARPLSQSSSMEMKVRATAPGPNQNITIYINYSQKSEKTFREEPK